MDFWNKVNPKRDKREGWDHSRTVARTTDNAISTEDESGLSSPLTELSSLDDIEELGPMVVQKGLFNVDELNAALVSCNPFLSDCELNVM